ncbi:MAG: polyribonucleotide nucleotidyltransferase [Urechidicola sp.]|jgi:polyribonucleotide nucleotidyltransferase
MNIVNKKMTLPNGKEISIETGKLAKQADGSVVLRMGDTMLLATVVSNKDAKDDVDFLPLTIDYREKFASTGRFPGGFLKRETRPSDEEILTMRLVDRAMRPLFPGDYHADTQIMIQLMSSDGEDQPDALACLAASAAVAVSDLPFNGPVSEVRVIRKDGNFIVNPTFAEMVGNDLDMIIAGTEDSINMVEGEMIEVSEADMLEAIKVAHVVIKEQVALQLAIAAEVQAAKVKREYNHENHKPELKAKFMEIGFQQCYDIAKQGIADKQKRSELFGAVKNEIIASLSEEDAGDKFLINQYFKATQKAGVRRAMLDTKERLDGRQLDEIRPIWSEIGYLPGKVHGSAIFTRGETQSLTTLTLGSSLDVQRKDGALLQDELDFVLHYNFPPYSTGEARPIRGISRREIGHGNLALRALKPMIPSKPENPYTIRLVSEILESNGSSSMATVCAGTLALLDGGVKMKKPVSGIAMGLISDADTKEFIVLSDILGDEDFLGDMDFKICGTRDGITACQMDIKIEGLDYSLLAQALDQARIGRLHILDKIEETISAPREDYKPHVPRIKSVVVPNEAIGGIIGKGGETIQGLQKETGTNISITETEDGKGLVEIFADNKEGMDEALRQIELIAFPPTAEVGTTYSATVKNLVAFGAFCEILPGTDALLHVSEIAWERVEKVEDHLKVGQKIDVKVIGKDPKNGKMKISRKALLERPAREAKAETAE